MLLFGQPVSGKHNCNFSLFLIMQNVSENFSKAQNIRQWKVQLNHLMKPITPAGKKFTHRPTK